MADSPTESPNRDWNLYRTQLDELWDSILRWETRVEESRSRLNGVETVIQEASDKARLAMASKEYVLRRGDELPTH
jgi:hypothetical protein